MSTACNKNILITGASRGLGRVLVREFFRAGWNVAMVARDGTALEAIAGELAGMSLSPEQEVLFFAEDLSSIGAPERLLGSLRSHWLHLDALVNNAGIQGPIGKTWECEALEWEAAFRILLFVPVAFCRQVIPWMSEVGRGAIVNISGGGASGPRPHFTAYATAKTALVRFSETLAEECRDIGVRVNAVAPGAMPTAMLRHIVESSHVVGEEEYATARRVLKQNDEGVFQRAAECVRFLCEPTAEMITGRLVSAQWDKWREWPAHAEALRESDVYTLRRIVGRDRGFDWGDK